MQKLTIKLSESATIEFESERAADIIKQASFWSELPKLCPLCKAPVVFFYRNPQENDYYGLHCTAAKSHETNFGQYKDVTKGFYYKGTSSWKESVVSWDTDTAGQQTPGATQPAQANTGRGNFPEPTPIEQITQPIATNLGELATAKQFGMIKALARDLMIDADEECNRLLKCKAEELSKTAASSFINHLQKGQANRPSGGLPPPTAPANPDATKFPTPMQNRTSVDDDIPF